MRIFVQNQGMREILPEAYSYYSEDKILSITPRLGEKTILQEARGYDKYHIVSDTKNKNFGCLHRHFSELSPQTLRQKP